MTNEAVSCQQERPLTGEPQGRLVLADSTPLLREILQTEKGTLQMAYLDPPFFTGQVFDMKVVLPTSSGKRTISLDTYDDRWPSREAYLAKMREILSGTREMLNARGTIFVHVDPRISAHIRLLLDDLFGESHFLNEIVWGYQTGGRSRRFFSRKHDTILFYGKTSAYYFNLSAVPSGTIGDRQNHMKRQTDETGRTYRSIFSGGREYRYYDDAPVYPGDVWSDISHLQQKDPERTGFITQKPEALLERIIRSSTQEGDLVADFFCGSGTTAVVAAKEGRRFLTADSSELAIALTDRRLAACTIQGNPPLYSVESPCIQDETRISAECIAATDGWNIRLLSFRPPRAVEIGLEDNGAVDHFAVGYLRGENFYRYRTLLGEDARDGKPVFLPAAEGIPALLVTDCFGKRRVYRHTLE